MTSRICWECDQELAEYDEGHIVVNFDPPSKVLPMEDWKIYCDDCWVRMMKDKEGL